MKRMLAVIVALFAFGVQPAFAIEPYDGAGAKRGPEPIEVVLARVFFDLSPLKFQKVALEDVVKNPRAYLGQFVIVDVRFHRLEAEFDMPVHTPVTPQEFTCFSGWDANVELWNRQKWVDCSRDVFFVNKELDQQLAQTPAWKGRGDAGISRQTYPLAFHFKVAP